MKVVHEIRPQPWQQQKSAGPLPIILGAVIAFGIGLLGVSGVIRVPALLHAKTHTAPVVIETNAQRLGNAEDAPLLKACVPLSRLGFGNAGNPARLYSMLRVASGLSRVAAATGFAQKSFDDAQIAAIWADVADCVYRQNGWTLCDPNNRALAAETASTFVRQLSTAERAEQFIDRRKLPPGFKAERHAYALQNSAAIRDRVLSGIRAQVAEGRLIATDFGMLAPSEITQIARETKVSRDGCARGSTAPG
jgi:hypothetical protein